MICLLQMPRCCSRTGTVRSGQTVEIENGIIKDVRPFCGGDLVMEAQERLDGTGKLVMPGLADCHMHTGQQLLKGKVLDALPMIWTRIMLPFESTLTDRKMELSASLAGSGDDQIRNYRFRRRGKLPHGSRGGGVRALRSERVFSRHRRWMRKGSRIRSRRQRRKRSPRQTACMTHTTEEEISKWHILCAP